MRVDALAAVEPSYLNRLALHALPFASPVPPMGFYHGPHLEPRLNFVRHLLHASDRIPVLRAAQGMGKTSVLQELLRTSESVRCCYVQADVHTSLNAIALQGLQQLGHFTPSPEHDLQATWLARLAAQIQSQEPVVLLLDDAHLLSQAVREGLMGWLAQKSDTGEALLRLVVSSEPCPTLEQLLRERMQLVDLPALTAAEIPAYLQHRLEAVGYLGELPFSLLQLKQLYRASKGRYGALNQLAHQVLLGQDIGAAFDWQALWHQSRAWLRYWWGIPVVLALGVALWFQQQINQWMQTDSNLPPVETVGIAPLVTVDRTTDDATLAANPDAAQAVPAEFESVAPTLLAPALAPLPEGPDWPLLRPENTSQSTPTPPEAAALVETTQSIASPSSAVEATPLEPPQLLAADHLPRTAASAPDMDAEQQAAAPQSAVSADPSAPSSSTPSPSTPSPSTPSLPSESTSVSSESVPVASQLAEPRQADRVEPEPAAQTQTAVAETPASASANTSSAVPPRPPRLIHDVDWVLAQPDTFFTFQLMGSWEEAEILRYIEQHDLRGNLALFASEREGAAWYVLLYGRYPDREQAQSAQAQFTGALRQHWLRSYASVKQQIQERGITP